MSWGYRAWVWFAARLLWTSLAGLLFCAFASAAVQAFVDPRLRGLALSHMPAALAFGAVFAGSAWHAAAVWRGRASVSETAMQNETNIVLGLGIILSLMAAMVWPYFKDLVQKSVEGTSRSHLSLLRGGLSRRPASQPPPAALEGLLAPGELATMPELRFYKDRPHPRTRESVTLPPGTYTDSGRWGYSVAGSSATIFIDCTHTDLRGSHWTSY